jgi:hypothetical protein
MKRIIALAMTTIALCAAVDVAAAPIAASTYSLTGLTGTFEYGRTDWNGLSDVGYVNDTTDISRVQTILSDGYTAMSSGQNGQVNAIYSGYPGGENTIAFAFNSGMDYVLNSLTFLSSRSYASNTTIVLEYALNGGAWQTTASTTTGALGISTGNANNYTLNFGGVTADAFRLVLNGSQISFHEISLDGAAAAVPEPTTIALLGLGLLGFAVTRRKPAKSKRA